MRDGNISPRAPLFPRSRGDEREGVTCSLRCYPLLRATALLHAGRHGRRLLGNGAARSVLSLRHAAESLPNTDADSEARGQAMTDRDLIDKLTAVLRGEDVPVKMVTDAHAHQGHGSIGLGLAPDEPEALRLARQVRAQLTSE